MKLHPYFAAAAALGLVSCSSDEPTYSPTVSPVTAAGSHPVAARYVALPGQAAVAVSTDVDDAFDRQAAAYAAAAPAATLTAPETAAPTPEATAPAATEIPTPVPVDPVVPATPSPDATATTAPAEGTTSTVAGITGDGTPATSPEATAPDTTGNMNYKIRIKNATTGRLFVEAQDAAGTIYPCGFMEEERVFTTPLEHAAPIKGPITIVVRDPDQPNAPEIRRYKVNPPAADYNGKAIGVDILPGGRYSASLDGQTYYASPAAIPTPAAPVAQ